METTFKTPIENAVAMFKKWKGDRDADYVYDEIHEFTVDFSRGELAGLMNFLEANEKLMAAAPDMLNALQLVHRAIENFNPAPGTPLSVAFIEIDTAIQKATA